MAKEIYEAVDDEKLINLIETGVSSSVGDFLNSSDLTRERLKATYEFALVPEQHLSPRGVSKIVDTGTTEAIEGYNAIIAELMFSNRRLAKFIPYSGSIAAKTAAKNASDITNYCIFKQNNGWEILTGWNKSALLWKNGIIRWDYIEDYDYVFEEFDEIDEIKLDELLSDDAVEIVGELVVKTVHDTEYTQEDADLGAPLPEAVIMYIDVRIKRRINKSMVKLTNVLPENFRITRDASSIDDAAFVGIQTDMSRSEIRKQWPHVAEKIDNDFDWDELGGTSWSTSYTEEQAARKHVTGQEYWQGSNEQELLPLEANRQVTVTECWLRVDRDGDGIAELKRFIVAGNKILHEEDTDQVQLASLSPIDIPGEFFGLSMADFARPSTLASTAILRGFVENTYLTNYAPMMADPNVVDFEALQNIKPKQVIPTNGSPAAAATPLAPQTISPGTVPLLQHLQEVKEQATGMSKAAQGLNDTLYVSGNSEAKLGAVQNASQKRIQHIARRFAETGYRKLCLGVYKTIKQNIKNMEIMDQYKIFHEIDVEMLPLAMDLEVEADLGDNSNANMREKMVLIAEKIVPMITESGQGHLVKPEAMPMLVSKIMSTLEENPGDYIYDPEDPEEKMKIEEATKKMEEKKTQAEERESRKADSEIGLAEANVAFTQEQAKNSGDDNLRQFVVALDKSDQEWAEIQIKAGKEGVQIPPRRPAQELVAMAREVMGVAPEAPAGPQLPPEILAAAEQAGIDPSTITPEMLQELQGLMGQ